MAIRNRLKPVFLEYGLLGLIMLGGLTIRLQGIGWGLPYMYHADEFQVVRYYLKMVQSLNLNPGWFTYPGLALYINAFFYGLYYMLQRRLGNFQGIQDIALPKMIVGGTGVISDPNVFYLGRMVSILFGMGVIYLSFRCAKEVSGKPLLGLLAAAFTAFSNANVVQSRLILPNIYVAFFAMLSIWFSLRLYKTGKPVDYLLAGLSVGLTAASKYNGGAVLVAPVCAHFLRAGWRGWKDKNLAFLLVFSGIGYIVPNIYDLFDFKLFIQQFLKARNDYAHGWLGATDNAFLWYLSYLWRMEGIVAVAALGGIVYALIKRWPQALIAGIFPLAYFIFLSTFRYYNEQTILHMLPALHVMGAVSLGMVVEKGLNHFPHRRSLALAGAAFLVLAALLIPLRQSVMVAVSSRRVTGQETARVWIDENLPPGSRIALESYSPYVNPEKFQVTGVALRKEYSWYREQDFDYLVFSQGMYGRFFSNPQVYGAEVQAYEQLFHQLELVKIFTDGDYEIRIYRIKE